MGMHVNRVATAANPASTLRAGVLAQPGACQGKGQFKLAKA